MQHFLFSLLPHKLLSRLAGLLANSQKVWLKNFLIRWLIKRFAISLSDYERQTVEEYHSVNDFFTRALKPQARAFDENKQIICSPADGVISETGRILLDCILQVKNKYYSVTDLLTDEALSNEYYFGSFMTVYLAPHNYHRVHMPLSGRLKKMLYVPGRLFSVNSASVTYVPDLFCRNERVIFLFEGESGPFAVIMVGAFFVGSIATAWDGVVTHSVDNMDKFLEKGAELGRFQFGSTVILLLPRQGVRLDPTLQANTPLVLGQTIGEVH